MNSEKSDSLVFRELMINLLRESLKGTDYSDVFIGTSMSTGMTYPALTVRSKFETIVPFEAGLDGFSMSDFIATGKKRGITLDKITGYITSVGNNDEEVVNLIELARNGLTVGVRSMPLKKGIVSLITDNISVGNPEQKSSGEEKIFECLMQVEATWEQTVIR